MLVYLCAVLLGGALLAPWLYKAAQLFPNIAKDEFHFYVQNALLAMGLICIWPLARFLGLNSLPDLGLARPIRERKNFFYGFLFGIVSLSVAAGVALALGGREIRGNFNFFHLLLRLSGILLTALGVAFLEEILFRGAVFGSLRKVFHWSFALLLSSAIYAIVHFFADTSWTGPVTWSSGLQILPSMLAGFLNFKELVPAFINLTLAGILLGLAYQRTGTLWFSMGIHAGWVFWIKFNMKYTDSIADNSFFGSNRLVNGWLATIVLVLSLLIFIRLRLRKPADIPAA